MDIHFKAIKPLPLKDNIARDTAVWGQQCQFEKGKQYNLFAPSGEGKSTFTHILYGLRDDYTGQVVLGDQVISELTNKQLADIRRKDFSIVFQDLRLFPELSAEENIKIKSILTPEYPTQNYLEWAEFLGVRDQLPQSVKTLSFGERQRIAIIRALVQPFQWLILDEPFSHLDNTNIDKAASLINTRLKEQEAGLIFTSLWPDDILTHDFQWHI